MESEKTKSRKSRDSLTDEELPDDDFSQSPVRKLPPECLMYIFSWLPIADRVRIQRVCKHWRKVSLMSWSSYKTLDFHEEDWGYKYWLGSGINMLVFEKVLKLCGKYLTRINFSKHYKRPESRYVQQLMADKCLFEVITCNCPKLTSIDITALEVTVEGLQYLGERYSKLTEFSIDEYENRSDDVNFDKPLALLFRNNKNLRRILLSVKSDGECLLELNPIAVEEIAIFHGLGGEENICRALKSFVNLSILCITDWSTNRLSENKDVAYMNEMLEAIEPHSENFKELAITCTRDDSPVVIDPKNFKCFSNLQKLALDGEVMEIDINTITKYCTKLTCVNLIALSVTDLQMTSIIQLPELQELELRFLRRITDAIFVNRMCSLKILECSKCPQLTNVGFRSLLRNSSESLQSLTITDCKMVDLNKLIEDAKESTDTRSGGSVIEIVVNKSFELPFQKQEVTKLSKYLKLTEYIYN